MKKILFSIPLLLLPLSVSAQYKARNGLCTTGAQAVVTQGMNSTNAVQASYPNCTVTVFLTGTTAKAAIYRDSTGTPLDNPFTANDDGSYLYYAAPSEYDENLSGGKRGGFPAPVTITDVIITSPSSGGGGLNPGQQRQLVQYVQPGTGSQGGPVNITTDAAGNDIGVPGNANITGNTQMGGTLGVTGKSSLGQVTASAYQLLPSSWNIVTDGGALCNWNGTTGNDDGPAIQALINAHPNSNYILPKFPAVCFSNQNITLGGGHLVGLGSNYQATIANPFASTMKFSANHGIIGNGIGGSIEHFNLLGSKLPAENSNQVANLIFPAGSGLTEQQENINAISVTGTGSSQVTTLYFNFAQAYTIYGTLVITGMPAPWTALNGLAFSIQTQCSNIHATCQLFNGGWVTINTFGMLTPVAHTTVAAGAQAYPGTTGTDFGTGITVTASGVRVKDMYIGQFGRNCIEINGAGIVADDPIIDDTWVADCGFSGYWAHGGDSNAEVNGSFKTYFNQGWGVFDTTFLHGSHFSPQASYNHMGAQGWSASLPGAGFALTSCTRTSTIVSCTTSAAHPYIVGEGVIISGQSDPTFNSPIVNGQIVSAFFVSSVPDNTHFSYQQPFFQTALADGTSTGGQVQLGSIQQIMSASAISGGAYWIDGGNDSANILLDNIYNEGGQYQGNNHGCGNEMGASVMMITGHLGDCIDQDFFPFLITAQSGVGYISPFTAYAFGKQQANGTMVPSGVLQLGKGFRNDSNSVMSVFDSQGGTTLSPVSNGIDFRWSNPGQNVNAWFDLSTVFGNDQINFYNSALLIGYGSSAESGETSATGTVTFTGTGLNDLTAGGTVTTTKSSPYLVVVCATGTPDSYAFYQGSSAPVGTTSLGTGGTGYAVGDTTQVRSNTGGNDFANITITGVSAGVVTSYAITYPGLSFLPALNLPTPGTAGAQSGPIRTSSVFQGGTGWNVGDTFTVFTGNPGTASATGVVTSVSSPGGAVTGYNITFPGSGGSYAVRTKGTTANSPSTGTGLVINITAVSGVGMTVNVLILKGMSTCTNMVGGANTLTNGVTATWGATTGHTLADFWSIPINVTFGTQPRLWSPNGIYVSNGPSGGRCLLKTSTSQPASGYYDKCDTVINSLPTAGGVFAWRCLASTSHACTSWETIYDQTSPAPLTGSGSVGGSSITNGTCTDTNIPVTGATSSLLGVASPAGALASGWANLSWSSYAITNNVVAHVCNPTAAPVTPTAMTFNAKAF